MDLMFNVIYVTLQLILQHVWVLNSHLAVFQVIGFQIMEHVTGVVQMVKFVLMELLLNVLVVIMFQMHHVLHVELVPILVLV